MSGVATREHSEPFLEWMLRHLAAFPYPSLLLAVTVAVSVGLAYFPALSYRELMLGARATLLEEDDGRALGAPEHVSALTRELFRLTSALHGVGPVLYQTNVALHALASGLVGLVAVVVLGLPALWGCGAAALFAVHPVHVEAVVYLVGREDLCAALCYLASILAYAACHCPTAASTRLRMKERRRMDSRDVCLALQARWLPGERWADTFPSLHAWRGIAAALPLAGAAGLFAQEGWSALRVLLVFETAALLRCVSPRPPRPSPRPKARNSSSTLLSLHHSTLHQNKP
jgi:hypothetical protein